MKRWGWGGEQMERCCRSVTGRPLVTGSRSVSSAPVISGNLGHFQPGRNCSHSFPPSLPVASCSSHANDDRKETCSCCREESGVQHLFTFTYTLSDILKLL